VLSVSTQNNSVNVTPEEYYIRLSWLQTEDGVNYTLEFRHTGNLTYTVLDHTRIPSGPGVKSYTVSHLEPGRLYHIVLQKNGNTFFTDSLATSKWTQKILYLPTEY